MNRFKPWLVACLLWTIGVTALYVRCPGCLDRTRDNRRCEWTGDTPAALDLQRSTDWRHLVLDSQLAEELAVRFADAENLRLHGLEGHGGLLEKGAVVRGCMSRMFVAIANNHVVAADQIQTARAERNSVYDVSVMLLFVPVYVVGALLVHRSLRRRFSPDPRAVRWMAKALASVALGFIGVQLAILWRMPWEAVRVGYGHIGGYRLATYHSPWEHAAMMVAAIVLFWLVDLVHAGQTSNDLANASASLGPEGILLH